MTGTQADRIRCRLELTQAQVGELFGGYDHTWANRFVNDKRDVPRMAAILLRLLDRGKVTIADIEAAR